MALPRGAMGLYAVCDCGISRSYSLTIFVPLDSTVNQLVDIYNTLLKALDNDLEVWAVFCDISKSFDRVWQKGLIYKLKGLG